MNKETVKANLICWYYCFIFWLEETIPDIPSMLNNHRKSLDEKYWNLYLWPYLQRRIQNAERRKKS